MEMHPLLHGLGQALIIMNLLNMINSSVYPASFTVLLPKTFFFQSLTISFSCHGLAKAYADPLQ